MDYSKIQNISATLSQLAWAEQHGYHWWSILKLKIQLYKYRWFSKEHVMKYGD